MRILVIPTSKHGGTAEIGRRIAEVLRNRRFDVDVAQPEHMFDLHPYGAFVVGSGLYMGNWIDRAVDFVDENAEALATRPTWLFSSGPLGPARPEEPVRAEVVEHLVAAVDAVEHRLFDGRLEVDRLGRTERFIAKWVGAADGDYRDWEEIDRWADAIADQLTPVSPRAIDGVGRATRPAF